MSFTVRDLKIDLRKTLRRFSIVGIACFSIFASSVIINVISPAQSQADHQDPTDSTWMPFIGEYKIWCTLATGTGPCATHHGTWGIDFDTPIDVPIYATG